MLSNWLKLLDLKVSQSNSLYSFETILDLDIIGEFFLNEGDSCIFNY